MSQNSAFLIPTPRLPQKLRDPVATLSGGSMQILELNANNMRHHCTTDGCVMSSLS